VVSLLLAYYDPDAGVIALDGYALRRHDPPSIRRQIAAVLQEPMLFQASVRDNLRYGRLDATDAEIAAAARAAQADDFIRALPEGYDTPVGPRGARLSGGQRQRLALARALLTEASVLRALRAGLADRTVLVVAHRLSTVRQADRIAVLAAGRIAELGSHEELLALGGRYRALYDSQMGQAT